MAAQNPLAGIQVYKRYKAKRRMEGQQKILVQLHILIHYNITAVVLSVINHVFPFPLSMLFLGLFH